MKKIIHLLLVTISVLMLASCSGKNTAPAEPEELKSDVTVSEAVKTSSQKYSRDEVAKHKTPEDCWTIFKGKVYNITESVPKHPAGPEKAAKACGVDISENFEKNPAHASKGIGNLEKSYIGDLE